MGITRRYSLLLLAGACFAQTPATPPLTFEVASIKSVGPLNMSAMQQGKIPRIGMKVDGQMVDIGSSSLRELIRMAYEVKDYQISGADSLGPPITAERFNIQATLPPGATEKDVPKMLQALLAERFKLVVHRDSKDQPVYALVVVKPGKLKESEPDAPAPEVPEEPKKGETVLGQGSGQIRMSGNIADSKGITVKGGPQGQMKMSMVDGRMHMEAAKMAMPDLCEFASRFVDRPVIDMTDLKGHYIVTLDLSMDDLKAIARAAGVGAAMGGADAGKGVGEASDPSGSSIHMSLQQMGLKLDARKAPFPQIVIDHFEKTPTDN